MYTLGEVAAHLGLAFSGDEQRYISGLAALSTAGPSHLAFYKQPTSIADLEQTRAGVVIVTTECAQHAPSDQLLSPDPYLDFARASQLFASPAVQPPGADARATIDPTAQIHPSASIGPNVVIASGVVIGASVVLGASVCIGTGSAVGAGSVIHPHVVIYPGVHLGRECTVHSQAVLGADGFGFARGPEGWEKIQQLAGVRIGDRVEIGAGTTIDCGTLEDTVIEDGVIIDNQVQIGHNCHIGRNTAIAGCAGLAGSSKIGANCTLAGGVGVVGHVEICDDVHVTGMTMVTRSISVPGRYSSGTPMGETAAWKRSAVRFSQLDSFARRLQALERRVMGHARGLEAQKDEASAKGLGEDSDKSSKNGSNKSSEKNSEID